MAYCKCDHAKDWNVTMGLTHSCFIDIHPMWKTWVKFQETIDERSFKIQSYVKRTYEITNNGKREELTHSGSCGHRTYFHWGFHASPYHIEQMLSTCINQWEHLDPKAKTNLINKCKSEQAEANREMIAIVKRSTNLSGQKHRNLAVILYDVHLLSDWQKANTLPLAKPSYLKSEISKAVEKLFRHKYNLNLKLQKELDFALHTGAGTKIKRINFSRYSKAHFQRLFGILMGILSQNHFKNTKGFPAQKSSRLQTNATSPAELHPNR